jgi:CheY-like chemotaxis protein
LKQLAAMPRLRRLDLTGTRVTDAGLEALKACRSLETLDVSLTAVTDLGLPHLARVKTLRRLSARGTRITHEGIEAQGVALEHVQAVFLGPAKGDAPSD